MSHEERWRRVEDFQTREANYIVEERPNSIEPTGVVEVSVELLRAMLEELGWERVA